MFRTDSTRTVLHEEEILVSPLIIVSVKLAVVSALSQDAKPQLEAAGSPHVASSFIIVSMKIKILMFLSVAFL